MNTIASTMNVLPPALMAAWRDAWPQALSVWSKFTRLSDPRLCTSQVEATEEGLHGSFAMIRLVDQAVVVNMRDIQKFGLDDYAIEILAHEIGHHVLAPASVTDHLRLLARMRKALPTLERHAAMIANLYTDLLINDRLQRRAGLRMADVYKKLNQHSAVPVPEEQNPNPIQSGLWQLYLRIYENLWQLQKAELGAQPDDRKMDTDAWLGARLVRVYANEWLEGAGRFATLVLPYLVEDIEKSLSKINPILDTQDAAHGADPTGLTEVENTELDAAIHPVNDERITGEAANSLQPLRASKVAAKSALGGQRREPFEYGEILQSAGIKLSGQEIAIRYYRESALPYLVPFPRRQQPKVMEPLIEGLEPWDIGDPLDQIDWFETLSKSPTVFSGMTTVKRQYGEAAGYEPAYSPVDLDIYIDCSGSMPDPQQQLSYLALAGAIIALSALRAGSKVQATLWSGQHEVISTPGFVRNEHDILQVITGFFGGGTAFPIHILRETHLTPKDDGVLRHILMISDEGITTMFDHDELGNSGWDISARVMQRASGGTMALNLPTDWEQHLGSEDVKYLLRAQQEQGWVIHAISKLDDLVAFASAFSRQHYSPGKTVTRRNPVITP